MKNFHYARLSLKILMLGVRGSGTVILQILLDLKFDSLTSSADTNKLLINLHMALIIHCPA